MDRVRLILSLILEMPSPFLCYLWILFSLQLLGRFEWCPSRRPACSNSSLLPVSRLCNQWVSHLSQGWILPWLALACVWFCFCPGPCFSVVGSEWGTQRMSRTREWFLCSHLLSCQQAQLWKPCRCVWQMPPWEADTPFKHWRAAVNHILWHRRKCISLAQCIVKTQCLN